MPFYEYECSDCKFYTEVLQKISDAPLTKCPSCGKEALKKLISAPVFRLKGGGWYETDFKGDKENKRNLVASDTEESSSKTEEKAGASKTEPSKAEASKPQAATAETSTKSLSKPASGSRSSSGSKASSGKSSAGTGRSAKPASKVAASKTRSGSSVRSKAKPTTARKKKGRR